MCFPCTGAAEVAAVDNSKAVTAIAPVRFRNIEAVLFRGGNYRTSPRLGSD